ncbi:MAG: DUF1269 domain-containing protein, partial [Gammaproteobacteria bacterium]|nr:DUF1269 domain-containing protein [Gammaproteobacteria bacterium]
LVAELREKGIPDRHLHVIADSKTVLEGLPEASMLQKSEFTHGVEMGIGVGGVAGLLGGVLAVTFPPAGIVLGGAAIIGGVVAGAGFGALVSGMVAHDIPNHELEAFEQGIAEGKILLLLDVPKERVDEFVEIITSHHPEAEIGITTAP